VWFVDHLVTPADATIDILEGWTVAAAVAARTSRIRIGHLVLCDGFRPAALLAKMASTLDVISQGRFELGLGWGSVPAELDMFGVGRGAPAYRAARLAETVEVVTRLCAGETVTFHGAHVSLDGAFIRPLPIQQPLPVHIGGGGASLTLPLVRRFATGWSCPSYAVDRLAELLPLTGDTDVSVQHPLAVVFDEAERAAVVGTAQRRFGSWGGVVAGTVAEVADVLAAEAGVGVGRFVVQLWDFATPDTIRRVAAELFPAVAARL
jgi:alkanesulfonate monooxygenase SsuD/methylene tetrahydromethanopterin reductase-like flavin-dependent oxidoreductase (luciferase family)